MAWSYADDRRVIELAKAKKSLEEAALIMRRTPKRIREVSLRLGVSFNSTNPSRPRTKAKRGPQ
jgi:hypothetical protein